MPRCMQMHGTEVWDEDQFRKFLGDASDDEGADDDDSDEKSKRKGGRGSGSKWAGGMQLNR